MSQAFGVLYFPVDTHISPMYRWNLTNGKICGPNEKDANVFSRRNMERSALANYMVWRIPR
jgi:hypothetical protein